MALLDITAFDGMTIVASGRSMVSMSETYPSYTRLGVLENGALFDADGTADADVSLGQVTVRYKITPTTKGVTALNSGIAVLKGLRGKEGTLTGIERAAADTTYTCTARCIDVIQEDISVNNAPPMHKNYYQRAYVTVVWQKKTEWV